MAARTQSSSNYRTGRVFSVRFTEAQLVQLLAAAEKVWSRRPVPVGRLIRTAALRTAAQVLGTTGQDLGGTTAEDLAQQLRRWNPDTEGGTFP